MQAWVKRAMASSELLRSDVESSLSWVGRASAIRATMDAGLRGLLGAIFELR